MQPLLPPGASRLLEGSPVPGAPGTAGAGAGSTLDVGVAIGVVVLLGNSLLPPNPTAKISIAAPPNSAISMLAKIASLPAHGGGTPSAVSHHCLASRESNLVAAKSRCV